MKGIREEYKSAKTALLSEQSENNYKEMISACYEMIAYYRELCKEGEFADVLQLYEKTALSFWKQYKTVESLCHIVYFYSDWNILIYYNGLPDMKQHLLKGLEYAQQYHNMEDADYSACVFVQHYLSLCETCRSGEGREQVSYAKKAYDLAKQYVQKYQTDQMLEQYKFAAMALACYYRVNELEEFAIEVERESEELAADVRRDISKSMQKAQEGNTVPKVRDIYGRLEDMCCDILPRSEEVLEEHRKDIYRFLKICMKLRDIAHYEGLDPLIQAAETLSKRNVQYCQMLAYGIRSFCECNEVLAENMLEHFPVQQEDCYMKFILYMCIRFLLLLQCGGSKGIVEVVLFSMIHPNERSRLKEYLKCK